MERLKIRSTPSFRLILLPCVLGLSLAGIPASSAFASEPSADDLKFFETSIRPLVIDKCAGCHGADEQESGLRLDQYAGMIEGGTSGPAVVPGNLEESLLIAAIGYQDENLQMPPDGKLSDAEIQLLTEWIQRGAPHPDSGSTAVTPRRGAIDLEEARKFWAFQPIQKPEIPVDANTPAEANPIDALVFAKLKSQGLTPNPAADKRTLIRRATFDLIGLPPTPEEIEGFLADESPEAFEKVIDRLLASRHYGERWGRHWLDVVRYADSNGQDENLAHLDAWRFRNYVIDAFNNDKPFDRFLTEQVAGDLLNSEGYANRYEPIIASGFWTLGPKVLAEKDEAKMEMDIIDEQIDVFGQAFLGLTLACARCHDHKFDPISTADYYALAGILKSSKSMQSFATIAKYNEFVLATPEEIEKKETLDKERAAHQEELKKALQAASAEYLKSTNAPEGTQPPADVESKFSEEVKSQLAELRKAIKDRETKELPTAMAMAEGTPADLRIHVRGSHLTLGKTVQRGTPEVLRSSEPFVIGPQESGRLQLARWLTSRENPLTARVAVNRVWRWHFGEGLVETTDNFGKLGATPSHPELLDLLAVSFMDNGWSMKSLHKLMMLSRTYQMSSDSQAENAKIDPENKFHWRANVERLDAEAVRDSLLFVSGALDDTPSEQVINVPKWQLVFDHTSKDDTGYDTNRRSVYLPVIRNNLYDGFSLFDYTSADVTTGSRETSTVAPQALYVMNSQMFLGSADALAGRLLDEIPLDEQARATRLYELALGRLPESHEVNRLLNYVNRLEALLSETSKDISPDRAAWSAACQSVLASNEFFYLN
ncbi:PSD1 and planctomycete cytochrome C domain-containing protein [Planctomicrobium sp. SH661]|uniref:PSD1 and planctomycete cytochrome C domain-containing protein n=1 Tax=Planctomicrobium sp. SH661 TaxID=3448124 RepID=UPI003F5B231A